MLSPFSITRPRSPGGPLGSMTASPSQDKEQIDIVAFTGGRAHLQRRSVLPPPPIGERSQAWGKYDTVQEIMSRPLPPPAIQQGQHHTMSMQGGRWSYFQPVNQLYILSKTSIQTPGPGHYGELGSPDPVVTGKTTPFGKLKGGRVSKSVLRPHSYDLCRVGKSVPGPGAYNTDHLFGIYARIRAAIPEGRDELKTQSPDMYDDEEFETDSDATSPDQTMSPGGYSPLGEPHSPGWVPDPIFDDGKETNVIAIEQRLTMSQAVPLQKMPRLGTTRYSRLRKDAHAPPVRKVSRPETRSHSAMSYFGQQYD